MKVRRVLTVLSVLLLVTTLYPMGVIAESDMAARNSVTLRVSDAEGAPAEGSLVIIHSLLQGNQVVFSGLTDTTGKVVFESKLPASIAARDGRPLIEMVYSAHIVTSSGELKVADFAVPHLRDSTRLSVADQGTLELNRVKEIPVRLQERSAPMSVDAATLIGETTSPDGTIGTSSIRCWTYPYYKECLEETRVSTTSVTIGAVHVSDGLTAKFTFGSSAQVAITAGYKASKSNSWEPGTSVTLSTSNGAGQATTVVGTAWNGYKGYGQYIKGNYDFQYSRWKQYTNAGSREFYTETPSRYVGGGPVGSKFWDSNDGRPYSDVAGNEYGSFFYVWNGQSTALTYMSEHSWSAGFTAPTPVGAFTGGVTSRYVTAHSIEWSTTSSRTYLLYDINYNHGNYWVTY